MKLVPGAAHAHQEHGVVALVGHAVGKGGHLLAGFVQGSAILKIALLIEVHDFDFLSFCHGFCPLSSIVEIHIYEQRGGPRYSM